MTKKIDFTKYKAGTKCVPAGVIRKCPKCGRNGVKRTYRGQSWDLFIHKAESDGVFMLTTDKCDIRKPRKRTKSKR